MTKHNVKAEMGSENVFLDLGFDKVEAEELLIKAKLMAKIVSVIKARKLKQVETAEILGIDQPKVSALVNGRLEGFSIERLIRFLNALDTKVDLVFSDLQAG